MSNVFLEHIYVMYALWFAAGVMLLAYIAYRRKRKNSLPSDIQADKSHQGLAH